MSQYFRSPWTTLTAPLVGPYSAALGDISDVTNPYAGRTDQSLMKQLHGIALSINSLITAANDAKKRGDTVAAQQAATSVQTMQGYFQQTADAFRANDPSLNLSAADQFILGVGQWVADFVKALPGAIAALPVALTQGLAKIAEQAGESTFGAILPWVGVGLVVLWFIGRAEKSPTVRRATRAAF